jgi:hypothetical protein
MATDPPYGVELDSEWRDRGGLNSHGLSEPSYMKRRTAGQTQTTISSDTRADWSEAFELVPSLQVAYVWHASKFTRQVLDGLLRIGFLHHQQIIWDKRKTVLRPGSGSQSRFFGAAVSIPATFATDCDRACVKGVVDQDLNAVIQHNLSAVSLTPGYRQTENAVGRRPGQGIWQPKMEINCGINTSNTSTEQEAMYLTHSHPIRHLSAFTDVMKRCFTETVRG